ncbi:MAG TPA: adenylate/guanylate cyclase domain-containing protein [Microvirga sp.]|jgi:adenylate cyclase|nr:adenylate/guanylate cyclase domain-containing protein [Microvirga sp.]
MTRLDGLARWLAREAPRESVADLFPAFCREVVACGLPLWRGSLALEVLHPEVSGWLHVWQDEAVTVRESDRATAETSSSYLNSPTKIVDDTNRPFRRRLDVPCPAMPLLEELREAGATDYFMLPLPFLDRTRTAAISFATRQAGGFGEPELAELHLAADLVGPYVERHVLRRIAVDLLDTYVGPRTGSRIIEGRIARGVPERIEAALWFTDLRGFTRFSEETPLDEVLDSLNAWFEIMAEVIEAGGGEVSKFIGDAVLAVFPITPERGPAAACRDALAAARAFGARTDAANVARAEEGRMPLAFGLALHCGEVAYGNVGAARRLDFTVMGPAVNRASRLLDLAKRLRRRVVVSGAFQDQVGEPLVPLGVHTLRDVPEPLAVFALP